MLTVHRTHPNFVFGRNLVDVHEETILVINGFTVVAFDHLFAPLKLGAYLAHLAAVRTLALIGRCL
ncbi:hypothetical protein BpHYR1_030730 [Brachionus plicatilis]|uniref:Uncharacterized protein n=1 Tax=Brachionus plicatilis TaxID=10195 RepID=A0A3M7RHX1_BRAPC|nr:hypothetical protein BpHYR1_030730 [Brachionus plicatilis]